jgi:hypothetical protein
MFRDGLDLNALKLHQQKEQRTSGEYAMKNKFVYLATVALMASGMVYAQSNSNQGTMDSQTGSSTASAPAHTDAHGDLPASKEAEPQSGKSTQSDSDSMRPGAMGSASTPNTGTSPKGETPATGAQTEQKGMANDSDARPGTDSQSTAAPNHSTDQGNTPAYAKPMNSTDNSTGTPSQKGTDTGTASPSK